MSRKAKVIAGLAALILVAGGVAYAVVGLGGASPEVEVATAERADLAVTVTASGRVESGVRADVFPPTAAIVANVFVDDGQRVEAGTVLARLETEPLELQAEQARAGVIQAESQLALLEKQRPSSAELQAARAATDAAWRQYQAALTGVGAVDQQAPSASDRAAAVAAVTAAYNAYITARDAYDALKAAYDIMPTPSLEATLTQAGIAKDQAYAGYLQAKAARDKIDAYDSSAPRAQAQAGADQAYAGYLAARAQQQRLETTNLSAEQRAAQAAVDQAREALVLAQDNLGKSALTAPIGGVVLFNAIGTPGADGQPSKVSAGAAIAPQAAPFTVVDMGALRFVAEVDEVDVGAIAPGMPVSVNLDAFPRDSFESTVTQILSAATLTPTGGTVFPVHVDLSMIEQRLLIGMKGDAQIEVDSVPEAVTVPIEALFDEGGTSYVYVVTGQDTLKRTPVELGTLTETRIQVRSGLNAGDVVALTGPVELSDGLQIRPKK